MRSRIPTLLGEMGNTRLSIRRNSKELVNLVTKSRTVLSSFAKAKTAKLGKERPHVGCTRAS